MNITQSDIDKLIGCIKRLEEPGSKYLMRLTGDNWVKCYVLSKQHTFVEGELQNLFPTPAWQ
jgi:hypothetical protein